MTASSASPVATRPVHDDATVQAGEPLASIMNRMMDDYRIDEETCLRQLTALIPLSDAGNARIKLRASELVATVRANRKRFGGLDSFLQEFGLSTKEGIALMCLAEALLRIPDAETRDLLIRDKIGTAEWDKHINKGPDLFVNASTWALMLTGKVIGDVDTEGANPAGFASRLVSKLGEPVVRTAMMHSMKILGKQFVMGRTIGEALDRAVDFEKDGYRFSYDMLGESARTEADAERYFQSYAMAIDAIGQAAQKREGHSPVTSPGISIKLSALHPRYEYTNRDQCVPQLTEKLLKLAEQCARYDIKLTVDAEEAHRLEMSLDIIAGVITSPTLGDWQGFGLAVQAYQRRAHHVIDFLAALCTHAGRRMMVRLVKGAYWDSEIKNAQVNGVSDYPVFTRKAATDVSYLACASMMLRRRDVFYPMFATHNAHTVAAIMEMAGQDQTGFEFQRLHGMGEPLYHQIVGRDLPKYPVRIYAPVGSHEDLLPYLVRRLLENGANSSFVNRLQNDAVPIESIIQDPLAHIAAVDFKPHPKIPAPRDIYSDGRKNSFGFEFADRAVSAPLLNDISYFIAKGGWRAAPVIGGKERHNETQHLAITSPCYRERIVGHCTMANEQDMTDALDVTSRYFDIWDKTDVQTRADVLDAFADLQEKHMAELMALCMAEAGKTAADAIAEVRESVDFCRYYAAEARRTFGAPLPLPGPTGESNHLSMSGRGVFMCISPWNFPLAIFIGQITAALAAGNTVIAKPAEQTPLIAARAVALLFEAGLPADALAFLPADGALAGKMLTPDHRLAGIAFTGSTDVARIINRTLAARDSAIGTLIAETGGLNAMIVDSSALAEQVVEDVIMSGFRSAGQRCSALRMLIVHESVADKIIHMLKGASATLKIGDTADIRTDIGPVIDDEALTHLHNHVQHLNQTAQHLFTLPLPPGTEQGTFFAPCAYELAKASDLTREVFGPIVHVVRYNDAGLDDVMDTVNAAGYGLTLGIHTRIEHTAQRIISKMKVGNAYVNRSMIGAVVGVQPFGGHGLSGTGPKAGGPHYLPRFANEKTVTVNTTASGGNTTLVSLSED